jgi:hypothetical protein
LTVWVHPNTFGERCEGSSVAFNLPDMRSCAAYCAINQGGPPRCNYISYDPINRHCRWSPTCFDIKLKDVDPIVLASASETEKSEEVIFNSIIQIFCSFTRDLYSVASYAKEKLDEEQADEQKESMKSDIFLVDEGSSNPMLDTKKSDATHKKSGVTAFDAALTKATGSTSATGATTGASVFDVALTEASGGKTKANSAFDEAIAADIKKGIGWRRRLQRMAAQMKSALELDQEKELGQLSSFRYLQDNGAVKQHAQESGDGELGKSSKTSAKQKASEFIGTNTAHETLGLRPGHATILNVDGAMVQQSVLSGDYHYDTVVGLGEHHGEGGGEHHGEGEDEDDDDDEHEFEFMDDPYHVRVHVNFPHLFSSPEGLTQCYDDCHKASHCEIFAYSEESTTCILVGQNGWYELERASAHLLGHSSEEAKIESSFRAQGFDGPPYEYNKPMPEWLVALYKTFRIYMMHDMTYTLYDKHPHKYECICVQGYQPDESNWTQCVPPPRSNITQPKCTRVVVQGAMAAGSGDDDIINFDYSDGIKGEDTDIGVFEECMLFMDCNNDMVLNQGEVSCQILGGECNIEVTQDELYTCRALMDPNLQSGGYKCKMAEYGVGVLSINVDLRSGGTPDEAGCLQRPESPAEVALSVILNPINGTEVFSPGPNESPEQPFYYSKGWCALCWEHSCKEIEAMEFNTHEFSAQQSAHIFWDKNTYADTIGACLMCTAESSDPTKCSFMQPEVQAEQWPVCDDMCAYFSCFDLESEAAEQLDTLNFPIEWIGMLAHRIVLPLCYGCDAAKRDAFGDQYLCRTKYDENYDYEEANVDSSSFNRGSAVGNEDLKAYFEKYPPGEPFDKALQEHQKKTGSPKKQLVMSSLSDLPQEQQDKLNLLPEAELIAFVASTPDKQMTQLGFSIPKGDVAAVNEAQQLQKEAADGDPSRMSKQQLLDAYGVEGNTINEASSTKGGAVSAADVQAKKKSSVEGGEMVVATPADLIAKLPLDQQMYLGALDFAARQKFIAASGAVQMTEAGFEMDPVAKQQILAASSATVTRTAAVAAQAQIMASAGAGGDGGSYGPTVVETEVEEKDHTDNRRLVSGWGLVSLMAGGGVVLVLASAKFARRILRGTEPGAKMVTIDSGVVISPSRHVNIVLEGDLRESDTMCLRPNDGALVAGGKLDLL